MQGRAVYWIGDPTWPSAQGFVLCKREFTVQFSLLEMVYDRKLRDVLPRIHHLKIAEIMASPMQVPGPSRERLNLAE